MERDEIREEGSEENEEKTGTRGTGDDVWRSIVRGRSRRT